MGKILIIGAAGQIGTELVVELSKKHGKEAVIAADIKPTPPSALKAYDYRELNILAKEAVITLIKEEGVTDVYLLAALLSATAEENPDFAWKLNMEGLFTILDLAKEGVIKKIFWPSSIAVFGPTTPKENTPQQTIMEPSTVYGISKQAGEQWCAYYHKRYGVDVRSIRYPGLISYTAPPGGGTTDYAVEIFYHAKSTNSYTSFLSAKSALPMMYMEDAIRATISLMEAPAEKLRIRTSYNLAGISITPEKLSEAIQQHLPEFKIAYAPDFRQKIADSWPSSIDDTFAQEDWGWKINYTLEKLVKTMLDNVDVKVLEG